MRINQLGLMLLLFSILLAGCNNQSKQQGNESGKISEKHSLAMDTLPVLGIDVSHYQGEVDWEKVKGANITFMYTKATQGVDYTDSKFTINWSGAKEVGVYRGAYHFYISKEDPVAQAEFFLKHIGDFEKGEMPPVLDVEEYSIEGDSNLTDMEAGVLKWLATVEKALGVKPMVYCDPSFANTYLTSSKFAAYKLWVAEYGAKSPIIPNAWKGGTWTVWQRTPRGEIEGVEGNVDHDIYNGNLKAFTKELVK